MSDERGGRSGTEGGAGMHARDGGVHEARVCGGTGERAASIRTARTHTTPSDKYRIDLA